MGEIGRGKGKGRGKRKRKEEQQEQEQEQEKSTTTTTPSTETEVEIETTTTGRKKRGGLSKKDFVEELTEMITVETGDIVASKVLILPNYEERDRDRDIEGRVDYGSNFGVELPPELQLPLEEEEEEEEEEECDKDKDNLSYSSSLDINSYVDMGAQLGMDGFSALGLNPPPFLLSNKNHNNHNNSMDGEKIEIYSNRYNGHYFIDNDSGRGRGRGRGGRGRTTTRTTKTTGRGRGRPRKRIEGEEGEEGDIDKGIEEEKEEVK